MTDQKIVKKLSTQPYADATATIVDSQRGRYSSGLPLQEH
jgi:hypothetical protein